MEYLYIGTFTEVKDLSTSSTTVSDKHNSNSSLLTSSTCFLLQVPKLIEGREYIIRIMAQNIYGISDPLLSSETKARDIFSKS